MEALSDCQDRDQHGSGLAAFQAAAILRQGKLGSLDLARSTAALQLFGQLDDLRDTRGPHRVASLLTRGLLGTHQGAVSAKHLDYSLDEFTFRFNRRTSRARGLLFHRLVEQAVRVDPVRYKQLVGGKERSNPNQ